MESNGYGTFKNRHKTVFFSGKIESTPVPTEKRYPTPTQNECCDRYSSIGDSFSTRKKNIGKIHIPNTPPTSKSASESGTAPPPSPPKTKNAVTDVSHPTSCCL